MNQREVRALRPGLYRIQWKDDDRKSLAAVGIGADGRRWLAPTNWIAPSTSKEIWRMVLNVEQL